VVNYFSSLVSVRDIIFCSKKGIFNSNSSDDLAAVQIFGSQGFTMGAFGGHDDKRIPKGKVIEDGTIDCLTNEHGADHHRFKP